MAGDAVTFVDANVLIYAHDRTDASKQLAARTALETLWDDRTGRISTQVLQEFYAVATRKLAIPMARQDAREVVSTYSAWPVVTLEPSLIIAASHLEEARQLSFWDALIVEAARVVGAGVILTEDLQHGAVIECVRIQNPFLEP